MTIDQLVERLKQRRDAIDVALAEIRAASAATSTRAKAKQIIESVKGERLITTFGHGARKRGPYTKKKLHWSQTPEGKKKMSRIQKQAWKDRAKRNFQLRSEVKP